MFTSVATIKQPRNTPQPQPAVPKSLVSPVEVALYSSEKDWNREHLVLPDSFTFVLIREDEPLETTQNGGT